MSEYEDAFSFLDERLPRVTERAVAEKLADFRLTLAPGRTMRWLTVAVRRSLAVSASDTERSQRRGNAEKRDNLLSLAEKAKSLWLELECLDFEQEEVIWDFLHSNGGTLDDYAERRRSLMHLTTILMASARAVGAQPQSAKWRQAETRAIRVERGRQLAFVFESAYAVRPTSNDFPSGKARGPSPFMDFYQRMVDLAFAERCTPDIAGVLKAAISAHKRVPYSLSPGVIPRWEADGVILSQSRD